jgi:hypothetical protein
MVMGAFQLVEMELSFGSVNLERCLGRKTRGTNVHFLYVGYHTREKISEDGAEVRLSFTDNGEALVS